MFFRNNFLNLIKMTKPRIFRDFDYCGTSFTINNINKYSIEILFNQIVLINEKEEEYIIENFNKYILNFNEKCNSLSIKPNDKIYCFHNLIEI